MSSPKINVEDVDGIVLTPADDDPQVVKFTNSADETVQQAFLSSTWSSAIEWIDPRQLPAAARAKSVGDPGVAARGSRSS